MARARFDAARTLALVERHALTHAYLGDGELWFSGVGKAKVVRIIAINNLARTPTPEFIALIDPRSFILPLAEPLSLRSEVFAIARGDADFLAYLNTWIRYREEAGWLPQRRAYWLGGLAWREKL